VIFDGRDVTALPAHARCRAGIALTHQIPHPFEALTVFENVLVGATHGGGRPEREAYADCLITLAQTGLTPRANARAGTLTLLERKRLELARALATRPRVLLLDEIAGGLTEPEVQTLVAVVRQIRAQGVTLVWIEHIVHALRAVVDRLVAIDFGRRLMDGPPDAVMASPEVQRVYLGIEP
jgi:branched-chain amino acid transport system ATP-binding protein